MKLPRDISGQQLVKSYAEIGDTKKFIRQVATLFWKLMILHFNERPAIPDHKYLRIGTLNNILRAVANHKNISREDNLREIQNKYLTNNNFI